jgi:hypothetical protein
MTVSELMIGLRDFPNYEVRAVMKEGSDDQCDITHTIVVTDDRIILLVVDDE